MAGERREAIRFPISRKIMRLSAAVALPFLVLVVVLLISMASYSRVYDKIVGNLTIANNYNLNFKEEMDESLYKLVVGYVDYEEIEADGTLRDPYLLIGELRDEFSRLRDYTTEPESRVWLESLLRNIDTLKKRVDDVLENVRLGGLYDENIEELDNNIYILTELIQDNIQYYIYYQTRSMEQVTRNLQSRIQTFVVACGILLLLLVAVMAAAARTMTDRLLRPLAVLREAMEGVSRGNLAARAKVDSRDELERMAEGFNEMAANMERLVQKIKEDEQKMRRLDLRLLQEQINPHFLYNTLDTIVWLVEDGKNGEAVDMVVALSDFFRLVLSRGREFISLREERRHIASYLEIQEARYRDILSYEIAIDPALDGYRIPKLTLQPLVENALYHGIKYKRARGLIRIDARREGELLRLTVEDDGAGMEAEELAALRREIARPCRETERGFGLANVNERIRMYFGAQYGMEIESKKGRGTRVTLTIPAILQREEET